MSVPDAEPVFETPWEECPACGVKMEKIKYDPVYVDEAEMMDILF